MHLSVPLSHCHYNNQDGPKCHDTPVEQIKAFHFNFWFEHQRLSARCALTLGAFAVRSRFAACDATSNACVRCSPTRFVLRPRSVRARLTCDENTQWWAMRADLLRWLDSPTPATACVGGSVRQYAPIVVPDRLLQPDGPVDRH